MSPSATTWKDGMMYYYEPDTYYQHRSRRLGADDGCYSDGGIQVYVISMTAYWQLCESIYGASDIDLAPDDEFVVVECLMTFGGLPDVRPLFGDYDLGSAVEDVVDCFRRARRMIWRGVAIEYEIWHVVPDDELDAVYTGNTPERPSSNTVSPIVISTIPETGERLVMGPKELPGNVDDATHIATSAVKEGFDDVAIVWLRSDWATSPTLVHAYLYRLGYSLCHSDIAVRLGVVTDGRD